MEVLSRLEALSLKSQGSHAHLMQILSICFKLQAKLPVGRPNLYLQPVALIYRGNFGNNVVKKVSRPLFACPWPYSCCI